MSSIKPVLMYYSTNMVVTISVVISLSWWNPIFFRVEITMILITKFIKEIPNEIAVLVESVTVLNFL